jgi:hypothetical protein
MSEIEDARTAGTYVVSFDDAAATDRALVGGKGANLARLVDAGLPIPDGFCVTTLAYDALIDDSSIRELIRGLSDLDPTETAAIADAGTTLRNRLRELDVPTEIRESIEQALSETSSSPDEAYAIRSSATAEDLPEASFAGQQERKALAAAKRLEQQANHGWLGPVRKRLARQLIRTYRGYIQTREYPKQGAAHMFAAWHEALCDTGELLVTEGQLTSSEDIWFLRKDELFAALEDESIEVDIAVRHAEFEQYKSMDTPPVLTSEGEAPGGRIEREDIPDGALIGTGVSGGVIEGVARIVRDPWRKRSRRAKSSSLRRPIPAGRRCFSTRQEWSLKWVAG